MLVGVDDKDEDKDEAEDEGGEADRADADEEEEVAVDVEVDEDKELTDDEDVLAIVEPSTKLLAWFELDDVMKPFVVDEFPGAC